MNKQDWISRSREYGFDGFEVTVSVSKNRLLSWFDQEVSSFETSKQSSVSMRALKDGKIVSISLEKVNDKDMDRIFSMLAQQARYVSESEKDELVPVIACDETQSLHHYNRPSMEKVEEVLARMEQKLLAVEYVTMVNEMQWEDAESSSTLTNSLGLDVNDTSTVQLLMAQITMSKDGEIRDGYEIAVVEDLDAFDEDAFIRRLTEKVRGELGARSLSSRTCPVIFDNRAMTTLFGCFSAAFYGSLIARGISPLTGKIGDRIFSDKITVIDNPRSQDALNLQNYDDEGHPTYEKIVVDKGIFDTVLHNTKSALKMGTVSTGNGFSKGAGSTDVSSYNMYIVPGKDTLQQLEEKMGTGVVVTELNGMHAGVDFVSGLFSLQARGYLVENGHKVRPLTLFTVAGNFFDMMKDVIAVGSDLDWSYRTLACPSILFGAASIAGQEDQ